MRNLRSLAFVTSVVFGLVATEPLVGSTHEAHAQDASQQATAQALFDEGMRLFAEANYEAACEKFEASLKLVDAMGSRGKLAECYEKAGKTASAWAAYREVAVLAERAGQPRRAQVATERADRLKASLSYLTVVVPSEAQVPGLKITRNGILLIRGAYGTAIAADPGAQVIEVSADGYHAKTVEQALESGGRETVTIPVLEAKPVPKTPDLGLGASETQRPSSTQRIAGISAVAVGGGAVVVSAILGLSAKSKYDGAFDDGLCDSNNQCNDEGVVAVDDARNLATVSTVFAVSGVILAGAGTYLWLSSPKRESSQGQALQITPTGSHQDIGISLSGRF